MAQWERRAKCHVTKCVENIDLPPKSIRYGENMFQTANYVSSGTRKYKCMQYENPSI